MLKSFQKKKKKFPGLLDYVELKQKNSFPRDLILPNKFFKTLCRVRTTNHKLPIETEPYQIIPWDDRICNLCRNELDYK